MQYTIDNSSDGICEIKVTGDHKRPDDSIQLQNLARNIREDTGCKRFLFDMRQAMIQGNTMDIFDTGKNLKLQQFESDYKVALVYSDNMEDHYFLEDVTVNTGYTIRVFLNEDVARKWLMDL